MGGALLKGWAQRGIGPITVIDPDPSADIFRIYSKGNGDKPRFAKSIMDLGNRPGRFRACVVAIKPQVLNDHAPVLRQVAVSGALMISIAAGTHSEKLRNAWGPKARIVRAMPNTPGSIGEGVTGLYAVRGTKGSAGARGAEKELADELLSALGKTIWVDREDLIDVVTAVSGSGPAYLFLMAEVLTRAGVEEGLPYDVAAQLARATVAGAGALLKKDKHAAATLRKNVTSPNGTTAAALQVLMAKDGLQKLVSRAVSAARKRAHDLR
jgi:pyrroline-5-carboxylate reductase